MQRGSLTIAATGIQLLGHITLADQAWMKQADKLWFAGANPVMGKWLPTLNPTAEVLLDKVDDLKAK